MSKNKALKDFNGDVSAEVLDFIKRADEFRIKRQKSRQKKRWYDNS